MATKNTLPVSASPEAAMLSSRLDALNNAGHSWMDPMLQVHLAQNGGSNDAMLNTAGLFKNVAAQQGQLPTHALADSVLNAIPSGIQKAFSALHNIHGPVPILTDDVTQIQTNLQKKGYGTDLTVGAWNPQWNFAMSQHAAEALKAPGTGNVKSLPFWKKVLGEVAPSTWTPTVLHAVSHYVHSLPGDLRQVVADVAGESGNYYDPKNLVDMVNPFISKEEQAAFQKRTATRTAGVENALGGKIDANGLTPAEMNARSVKDLGNILNLILLKGAGGAAFSSLGKVGEAYAAGLGEQATVSSAAKALVTRSLPEEFAAVPRFTVVKSLYQAGAAGEKGTGILRGLENVPVLKRMLPVIDAANAEGSKYFAMKQALAQSARIPLKQAGAVIQTKGMMAGLGLLGTSAAEKAVGAQPTYDATTVQPYAGVLGNAMDIAGMFVGSPTRGISASKNVGQAVSDAHTTLSNAAGSIGIDVAIRKGLGLSLKDLKSNLGEAFVNDHYINTKLNQFSASHFAEKALNQEVWAGRLDRNTKEAQKFFMDAESKALNDPATLAAERESLIAQPSILANYYKKDAVNTLGKNVRKGIDESYDITQKDKARYYESMNRLKATHSEMANLLHPDARNLFHGSATISSVEDLLTKGLNEDWALRAKGFDDVLGNGTSPRLFHVSPGVNEVSPTTNKLAKSTPYGFGVSATDNVGLAGRANANIYNLTHAPVGAELPKFYDMTKSGNSSIVSEKIRSLLGGTYDAPAGALANSTTRQYRDELGLMKPGKTPGTLVPIAKADYSKEYLAFRKVATNPFDYSAQQVIDAYRKALLVGGKMSAKQIDARIADITKSAMDENGYTGFIYNDKRFGIQHVINPERVKADMVKQDPKWTRDSLIPGYLQDNNIVGRGALGIARKDTFIAQDAQRESSRLFQELTQAGHGAAVDAARSTLELEGKTGQVGELPRLDAAISKVEENVLNQARGILVKKLGFDANEVTRLDPIEAISTIWRESKTLASEAYLPLDAPQHLKDSVARLDKLGYRPVLGTDIGHSYEAPLIHPAIVNQRTSMLRKAALALGMDISKIDDLSVAQNRRMNVENQINNLFSSGKVQPTFGDNGSAIYSILLQAARSGEVAKEGKLGKMYRGAVEGLVGSRKERFVENMLGDTTKMTFEEIQAAKQAAAAKSQEIFNNNHNIRDLSLKQMVKALTRPVDPKDILGATAPRYTPEDAMKIAKQVLIGYAKTPASLVGWGKAEDFIRASNAIITNGTASFFGQVPLLNKFKIGEGPLANQFAALPNDLARLRDKWRFEYSPVFAFRRLAKTNVKAAAEGVPVTRDPYMALQRQGKTEEAFNLLQRTMPDVYKAAKDLEPLDKFLQQGDMFGVYNPAHMMAWQAQNLKELGLTDAEIQTKLVKINTYGERTPLERSINTIFYPFSFNKTLYRSIGGYILDNPGHAMLINAGFNLYQHYDPNNDLGKWVTKHAPLLDELKKLNAFEHGTGLGQFGGINTPYISQVMNLFSPQKIVPENASAAILAWKNAIPVLSELNTLLFNYQASTGTADFKGSLVEAGKVGWWQAQNLIQHATDMATGHTRVAYQTTLTDQAQVQAGLEAASSLKMQLAAVLDTGAVWPSDPSLPKTIWGEKISATSIGKFVQSIYPAYDPKVGANVAIHKAVEAKNYVKNLQGTFRYEAYNTFQTLADKTVTKLRKTEDAATIMELSQPLRTLAVNIAEQDSKFAAFYTRYYASTLGPIEGLTK